MRKLTAMALANAGVHLAGLVFAIFLRPGTPLEPLPSRMAWLAQDPLVWKLGWICWMVAALCVGGLFALLTDALGRPILGLWAVALGVAGAAIDILSEIIYINVLPGVARSANREMFVAFESVAFCGGCVLANGFYTLGVWLIALEFRRAKKGSFWLDLCTAVTVACGTGMSIAGLIQSAILLEYLTGPTIVGFAAWGVIAAGRVNRAGKPEPVA